MQFQAYCVGTQVCAPTFENGPRLELTESGFILRVSYVQPSAAEIDEIRNGKADFCAVDLDGVLVFMARFGRMPWMDMTFHRGLANSKTAIRPAPRNGTALHIMLVDSATGVLKAQRVIGLMNRFSHDLADMIESQSETVPDNWAERVASLYRRYTTTQLVAMATTRN